MKAMKIVLTLFLSAALAGCKDNISFEEAVIREIEQDVKSIYAEDWGENQTKVVFKLISSNTNNSLRIKLFTMWGDAILAAKIPMQTNDYYALRRITSKVTDRIRNDISSGLEVHCEGAKEELFDMRFKLIEWQKKCLDELLVVSQKIGKDEYQGMRWRDCYTVLFHSYRANLNNLEFWWYPYELEFRRTPKDEMDSVRKKIEKFLGRKLRTPEDARANREWETEIYKKVRRRELP